MNMKAMESYRDLWVPALVFVLIAAIYLCFPTKNYYWDGIAFAQAIEDPTLPRRSLVHPNHLYYNLVGYYFYQGLRVFGMNLRAIDALQILNSVLSALAAMLLFRILKETMRSIYFAITLTLLFAFSATWWKYSTDADAYIASVLFLLLSFYFALPGRKPRPVLVALAYTLSLLFHQLAIICFPVLAIAVFIQSEELTKQRRFLHCVCFSAIAAALTLGSYIYSYYLLTGQATLAINFWRWTLSFSPDESFGFRPLINLGFTLRGHGRLFFGGRLNAISGLVNPAIIFLIVVGAGLLLVFLYKVLRSLKVPGWGWINYVRSDPERSKIAVICLLWIGIYIIALYGFAPHNTFYRLFYLPALIILIGLILSSHQRVANSSRQYRLAVFVALVAIANFLTLIYPYSHVEKYPPLAFALELNRIWPSQTIVYYSTPNSDNSLVRYFNPSVSWKQVSHNLTQQLDRDLKTDNGVDHWLETTAIDELSSTPSGSAWLTGHTANGSQRFLITKAHNIRFVRIVRVN